MPLEIGSRLGHYEITALIGEGGMGQVYQATDTKLGRQVALKILPESFASDPDRLMRFEREARTLATLNHPNVAQIHGVEAEALVLELVEGPTLADRIDQGPIPLEDALPMAIQIAGALEAAHDAGVIHRDLKPANIKVRPDGTVKVLDFGLAKAMDPVTDGPAGSGQSMTVTSPAMTAMGMILGTAAYMAPEQARGKVVDRRADIWAFGAVLFEMLTGTRAFAGDDVTDTLAAVVRGEPDWSALPEGLSPSLRVFLQRCLEKDPKRRVGDAHDVALALEGAFDTTPVESAAQPTGPPPPLWRRSVPLGLAGLALLLGIVTVLTTWLATRADAPPPGIARFLVTTSTPLTPRTFNVGLAMFPDGSHILYDGRSDDGTTRIFLRPIDQLDDAAVRGTEDTRGPFVSPDGQWIGIISGSDGGGHLQKIAVSGGRPITVAESPDRIIGATWDDDDRIIFGTNTAGLFQVSAAGGTPEPLTFTGGDQPSVRHGWPFAIPGRNAVVFAVGGDPTHLAALDLDSRVVTDLGIEGTSPQYASTGHLVYATGEGGLNAVPFDAASLTVTGNPVPLIDTVTLTFSEGAFFGLSRDGHLAYIAASRREVALALVWVDRNGNEQVLDAQPRRYRYPRVSPDGRRAAATTNEGIVVWDFRLETLTSLTVDPRGDNYPVWTPAGDRIAYRSDNDVYWKAANNTGVAELLVRNPGQGDASPYLFTPDGQTLVFREQLSRIDGSENLGMIGLEAGAEPVWLLRSEFTERNAVLSPNGRWLAYQSDRTGGRHEVYVSPFPNFEDDRIQISNAGGVDPVWSPDGRELFYLEQDSSPRLMVMPVQTDPEFVPGERRPLIDWPYFDGGDGRNFDVSPDGQRFLAVRPVDPDAAGIGSEIVVVLNWIEDLKARVPSGR